jgi:hypothetical protein
MAFRTLEIAMTEFFRTAVHFKNVPFVERAVRLGIAMVLVAIPFALSWSGWLAALSWGNAAFIALTAFVGFCPACYLVGRKLVARSPRT